MRLIDADALKEELLSWARVISDPRLMATDDAMCVIDHAPTVTASPWHRVEEPPKENGRYLVSWEVAVTTDEYKDGVWLYASMFNLHVTHWMPLPEPPKEDV